MQPLPNQCALTSYWFHLLPPLIHQLRTRAVLLLSQHVGLAAAGSQSPTLFHHSHIWMGPRCSLIKSLTSSSPLGATECADLQLTYMDWTQLQKENSKLQKEIPKAVEDPHSLHPYSWEVLWDQKASWYWGYNYIHNTHRGNTSPFDAQEGHRALVKRIFQVWRAKGKAGETKGLLVLKLRSCRRKKREGCRATKPRRNGNPVYVIGSWN